MERRHSDRRQAGSRRRLWPAGFLATALLLMATASWAQPQQESAPPDPAWDGPGRGLGPHCWCKGDMRGLRQRLDLTDEQAAKLESLRSDFLKETVDLNAQIQKKRLELGDLFRDPQTKQEKIEAAQKELNRLTGQKQEKAQAYRLRARGLLTAEQIGKLPPGCSFGMPWAGTMYPGGPGRGHGPGPRGGCCPYAM